MEEWERDPGRAERLATELNQADHRGERIGEDKPGERAEERDNRGFGDGEDRGRLARRAEEALLGAPATRRVFRQAAAAELEQARPVRGNEFKVPMAQGALVTVLSELAGLPPEEPGDQRPEGPAAEEGADHE